MLFNKLFSTLQNCIMGERLMMNTEMEIAAHVVWSDGTHDSSRGCLVCGNPGCHAPVHSEKYRVKADRIAQQWDLDNQVI
jgi:hypothetical protein